MDQFYPLNEDILLQCPPILRDNVSQLWTNNKIVVSPANIKIQPIENKLHQEDGKLSYKNYFKLDITYAGKCLTWEMIFNNEDYEFGPDFLFYNEDFLSDPDIDVIEKCIPSLANWDIKNSQSLTNVIKELIKLFKTYQTQTLRDEKFNKIYAQYESLSSSDFNDDDFEVLVEPSKGSVQFLFNIPVHNCNNLPPYMKSNENMDDMNKKINAGETKAILSVIFAKPDCSKVQTKLHLSPLLEQVFGNPHMLHIPAYGKTTELANYIETIKVLLEDNVEEIITNYRLKEEYISEVLSLYRHSVLEYDNRLFTFISLLFQVEQFYAIVHIKIGNQFPKEKPSVFLRSVWKVEINKPFRRAVTDYPYSPRWKPKEMVKRLMTKLGEELTVFEVMHNNI